jgi:hypothetical protein
MLPSMGLNVINWLWHMRGSIPLVKKLSDEEFSDRVSNALALQLKSVSEISEQHVAFDDPIWCNPFTPNWYVLVMFDKGVVWIESTNEGSLIRYDLRSLHMVIVAIVVATFVAIATADQGFAISQLLFGFAAFCFLYGVNLIIALFRVPNWLRWVLINAQHS